MWSSDKANVLVVDDRPDILQHLVGVIERAGYHVTTARLGRDVGPRVARDDPDLVVLRLHLPDISGITVLATVRQVSDVGIVMLGRPDDDDQRVASLELGADDFVVEPIDARELLARLHTILRRVQRIKSRNRETECTFRFEQFTLYPHRREVFAVDGTPVTMSSTEFSLLETFVRHPNEILTRERLLLLTYGEDISISERAIDVHVNRLRRKIEDDPKKPRLLKTVRHRGYLFSAPVTETGSAVGEPR